MKPVAWKEARKIDLDTMLTMDQIPVHRSEYPELFAVLDAYYGEDRQLDQQFCLPDLPVNPKDNNDH